MGRLQRYIFRQLILAVSIIVLAVTGAVWLTQALRFLEFTVGGGAPVGTFLTLAVLTLPAFFAVMLPVAMAIAIVFVYTKMTQDSELTVMRAVGVGPLPLAVPGIVLAALTALVVLTVEVWLGPASLHSFQVKKDDIRAAIPVNLLRDKAFLEVADRVTVYIDKRERGGRLTGIYLQDARDSERIVTVMAQSGELVEGPSGPQIIVTRGRRQEGDPDPTRVQDLAFERYVIDLSILARPRDPARKKADGMTLWELRAALAAETDKDDAKTLAGLFHKHLLLPLFALGLGVLTAVLLLHARFTRGGMARQVAGVALAALAVEGGALLVVNLVLRDPVLAPLGYGLGCLPLIAAATVIAIDRGRSAGAPRRPSRRSPAGALP